ncbi:hypothetical protein MKW92_040652 [Papaver armeniacum]|nr:hypothetical protein MKW92_040652 [Papaver armeniacum]
MASSLSSFSSLLNQPHSSIFIKIQKYRYLNLCFLSNKTHFNPSYSPLRTLRCTSSLNFPRNFSQFQLSSSSTSNSNIKNGPTLHDFISRAVAAASDVQPAALPVTPISTSEVLPRGRIYHETYGCQMNINDMEIVLAIMKKSGYDEIVAEPESAEVIFINTCAIRDNAEQKVWQRLNYFWFLKRQWKGNVATGRSQAKHPPKVVVLGCMAERLKDKILDSDKMVDVVCGPDAYRDLQRLLEEVDYGQKELILFFPLEETYADISPVRVAKNSISAFVSVMRGCNNMCSERSRPVESIVREVGELSNEGVKEIMLLGQNVNSYNDASGLESDAEPDATWALSEGFSSRCKVKKTGLRFADLLDRLSIEFPEIRFRYTSPHPKISQMNFLQQYLKECAGVHQRSILRSRAKNCRIVPDVGISSDFICGFCGETEEEHADTISLLKAVGYDMAYMFAYSMREKTHAHRNYNDDTFRETTGQCYDSQVGTVQLVLVEGPNKLRILKSTTASLFGESLAVTKLSSFYESPDVAVACSGRT